MSGRPYYQAVTVESGPRRLQDLLPPPDIPTRDRAPPSRWSGWHAFWTATDNRTDLDDDGILTAPLTVYHHPEVGRETAAALADVGLSIGARSIDSLVPTPGPARTGRPG